MDSQDDLKAFSELRGNTLRVYLYMVQSQRSVGVREVQKKLDFSSPTLSAYHLDKLETLGLAQKTVEGYVLAKEVKVGALSQVVRLGSLLLPRYVFYTAFLSVLLACYLFLTWYTGTFSLSLDSTFAILLGVSAITATGYECIRVWKHKPI